MLKWQHCGLQLLIQCLQRTSLSIRFILTLSIDTQALLVIVLYTVLRNPCVQECLEPQKRAYSMSTENLHHSTTVPADFHNTFTTEIGSLKGSTASVVNEVGVSCSPTERVRLYWTKPPCCFEFLFTFTVNWVLHESLSWLWSLAKYSPHKYGQFNFWYSCKLLNNYMILSLEI